MDVFEGDAWMTKDVGSLCTPSTTDFQLGSKHRGNMGGRHMHHVTMPVAAVHVCAERTRACARCVCVVPAVAMTLQPNLQSSYPAANLRLLPPRQLVGQVAQLAQLQGGRTDAREGADIKAGGGTGDSVTGK